MSDTNTTETSATAGKSRLYPLTGTVSSIKRGMTNGGNPKPYASFRFAYKAQGKEQVRTANAFGKGLENIEHLLVEGREGRMLGRFDTTEQGQTIVMVGVPKQAEAAAA